MAEQYLPLCLVIGQLLNIYSYAALPFPLSFTRPSYAVSILFCSWYKYEI